MIITPLRSELILNDKLVEVAALEELSLTKKRALESHVRGINRTIKTWLTKKSLLENRLIKFEKAHKSEIDTYGSDTTPVSKTAVLIPAGMTGPYAHTLTTLLDLLKELNPTQHVTDFITITDAVYKYAKSCGSAYDQPKIVHYILDRDVLKESFATELAQIRLKVSALFKGPTHPRPACEVFHHRHNVVLSLSAAKDFMSAEDHLGELRDRFGIVEENLKKITDAIENNSDKWHADTVEAVYRLGRTITDVTDTYGILLHELERVVTSLIRALETLLTKK